MKIEWEKTEADTWSSITCGMVAHIEFIEGYGGYHYAACIYPELGEWENSWHMEYSSLSGAKRGVSRVLNRIQQQMVAAHLSERYG